MVMVQGGGGLSKHHFAQLALSVMRWIVFNYLVKESFIVLCVRKQNTKLMSSLNWTRIKIIFRAFLWAETLFLSFLKEINSLCGIFR